MNPPAAPADRVPLTPPPSAARRAGSRLFGRFAAASLLPVVVLGLVLASDVQRDAVRRGLAQGRTAAAVIEEMAVAPALTRGDLEHGLTTSERGRLQRATDLAIFNGSVVRLRLRDLGGRVAFSDDGSQTVLTPVDSPAFRAALEGRSDAAVVVGPDGGDQVVQVVQPVVADSTGRAVGVLELHLPYERIAAEATTSVRGLWVRLAVGLGVLYAVLASLAFSTGRGLRRLAEDREHQALHDALTGLPNREWFRARAEQACASGLPGALALVDLDRFKQVNDTLGHHAGDELLRVIAERLRGALRADDTVARLGGDEFGLVLPGVTDRQAVVALLEHTRDVLCVEVELGGVAVSVDASVGVALFPEHGDDVELLLQGADAAMYQGKRGTAGVVVYEPGLAPSATAAELQMQAELRRALERSELVLHYQPKVDLRTGEVAGVEALVRWLHPQRGLVPPGQFLPVVERSTLVDPVTQHVLEQALLDCAAWSAAGLTWPVSVNISARNLETPAFPRVVADLLARTGVGADRLRLEVTETALAADTVVAAQNLQAIVELGVALSVDDFGIGYSSLSQLRHMPVAEVKVDRAFIDGVEGHVQDQAIVRSVIALAHGLGCVVTAEGVETAETAAWLRAAGCDAAQGYLFARPGPWPLVAGRPVPGPAASSTRPSPTPVVP